MATDSSCTAKAGFQSCWSQAGFRGIGDNLISVPFGGLGCPAVAPGRAVEDRDFRTVVGHEVNVDREGEGEGVVPWNAGSSGSAALEPPSGGSSWSWSVVALVCDGS